LEIHLAHTQGFCAGVSRAIQVVNSAIKKYGASRIYVYHHIVHNTAVISGFESAGVRFVEDIQEVPYDSVLIFSAHGVSPKVISHANKRSLTIIDATCPIVKKVHKEAERLSQENVQVILIGHKKHQEIIGTAGYVDPQLLFCLENINGVSKLGVDKGNPVAYLTQTTLSVKDTAEMVRGLRKLYPNIIKPPQKNICFATQNRQDAVIDLARVCEVIIICGSPNSSNSNRLRETALKAGTESYIIDSAEELDLAWIEGKMKVGISSGASVPKSIVDGVIEKIRSSCSEFTYYQKQSVEKDIKFSLPRV
jgi:4-hydroxy-3-methylbut-2-en-1-yl diphosphate reductase